MKHALLLTVATLTAAATPIQAEATVLAATYDEATNELTFTWNPITATTLALNWINEHGEGGSITLDPYTTSLTIANPENLTGYILVADGKAVSNSQSNWPYPLYCDPQGIFYPKNDPPFIGYYSDCVRP